MCPRFGALWDLRMMKNIRADRLQKRPEPEIRRKRGRPLGSERVSLTDVSIIRTAYKLTKAVPLYEVSQALVARTMGVTPALIHYYLGGRNELASGVMNHFYSELLRKMPEPTGDWEKDLREACWAMYRKFVERPGIAAYAMLKHRFRTFQLTKKNGRDYGIEVLERFISLVLQSGCTPARAGTYSHLLREFIVSSAYYASNEHYPASHKEFLAQKVAALDEKLFPAIRATLSNQVSLDAECSFREGGHLFIVGLRDERTHHPAHGTSPIAAVSPRMTGKKYTA
jgi:AcrR family transcriptional regulator